MGGRPSGPGSQLDAIEINQDFRGFTSFEPQGTAQIFADGFESGDTTVWSSTVP